MTNSKERLPDATTATQTNSIRRSPPDKLWKNTKSENYNRDMLGPTMNTEGPCQCPQSNWGEVPTECLVDVYYGEVAAFERWIDEGGNVNGANISGLGFLVVACAANNHEVVQQILQHFSDAHLNTPNKWGSTALISAARWGTEECIKLLIHSVPRSNCRVDLNAMDFEGLTALAVAAQYKRWNIFKYLLIPKVKYDSKNLNIALCETAKEHQWNLVGDLLQKYQGFLSHQLSQVLFLATECRQLMILELIIGYHFDHCDAQSLKSARSDAVRLGYFEEEKLLTSALDGYYRIPVPPRLQPGENGMCSSNPITIPFQRLKTTDGRPLSTDTSPSSSPELYGGHFPGSEEPVGRLELNVIPVSTPVPPSADVYDTTSEPRGIVLILNYNEFVNREDMRREGSYLDVLNLRNVCEQMGYETQFHYDLTKAATLEILDKFRNQTKLGRVSCALVAIMSHGISRHTFYTTDMNTINVNEVQNLFLDNQCPLLKNKPKIFLFNFCRGFDIPASLETDAVREQPRNIMCIYSTTESFLSYRDRNRGSPFIRALCEVLANHAHEMDLDNLIRKFQQRYLHNTTPEIQNLGFHKKFFFNPCPQLNQRFLNNMIA